VDASLINIETVPVCGVEVAGGVALPLEPPPPHPASSAVSALTGNNLFAVGFMIDLS